MDEPDKVELPNIDQDKVVAPHAQEIEYALILQRMINVVNEDPEQMRVAIYQLARARLKADTGWADEAEKQRLTTALETAIQGVEKFSVNRDERERLLPPAAAAQIGFANSVGSSMSGATVTPAREDILLPPRSYQPHQSQSILQVRTQASLSTMVLFAAGTLLFVGVAGLLYYKPQLPLVRERFAQLFGAPDAKPLASSPSASAVSQPGSPSTATAADSKPLPFPVPSDYGIYALNDGALSELHVLSERVPDKRVAMSTPVSEPSRTTLPDGKARFILFRRDLAGNAPERMDIRVVARVTRVLKFDAKGKSGYSPVTDAWNIRNVSYEFRVRPIAGNPEMLLVQSDKPDFTLAAGRYVLVLKDQGYDFTVAGKVTDLAQCLERTDAANGEFYSECQKP
jgi:hypothetical protein